MLNLLAQSSIPETNVTFIDILLWPVGLTLIAWVIFASGWWVENRLTKAPWKWLAFGPVFYGIYIGWGYLSKWLDPTGLYPKMVAMAGERKMMIAHWSAFIIPILGLGAIVWFHFFNHKLNINTDD